jgi:hypothetical protein
MTATSFKNSINVLRIFKIKNIKIFSKQISSIVDAATQISKKQL